MNLGLKEKAVLGAFGPAMNMVENFTKDVKPENEVAKFIQENFGILFESQNQKLNPTLGLLTTLATAEANDNPEFVLHKLLAFYEALRVWYPQYQALKKGEESA